MFGTRTQLTTLVADLASHERVDFYNFNPNHISFVFNKALQLEETPIAQHTVESLSFSLFPDSFQVFHYNLVTIKVGHNVFTHIMVYPGHKPSFSSRDFLQQSLAGTSAFGLEFTSQELEFSFDLFYWFEEPAVRTDGKVVYSEINAQNRVLRTTVQLNGINLFRECENEETPTFFINPQKAFINIPTEIFFVAVRDVQLEVLSCLEQSQAELVSFEPCTSWEVVPNRTISYQWFGLDFLDHANSLLDARDCQLSWQIFSERRIDKRVELDVISYLLLPCLIDTVLKTSLVSIDSPNYFFSWINLDFSTDCRSHINKETLLLFKYFGNEEERAFIPLLKQGVSCPEIL